MKSNTNTKTYHSISKVLISLVNKFTQSPDVYPIKYYMKGSRIRRRYTYFAK